MHLEIISVNALKYFSSPLIRFVSGIAFGLAIKSLCTLENAVRKLRERIMSEFVDEFY